MTTMDLSTLTCRLEGCGGPQSGVCINSLGFDECPDVISLAESEQLTADVPDNQVKHDDQKTTFNGRNFGVGDSLDAAGCDALLRAVGGKMIGIVAGPEAGKTTLIATIYEMIHRGMIEGIGFAGSETLRGYEERCHLARLASNAPKADTHRTPTSATLNFTHLRLSCGHTIGDVIFSDRSGEHFDNVLDMPNEIGSFSELVRADAIWLIVDLHLLSTAKHSITSQMRRLVMAMNEADLLVGKQMVLVGTKADLFVAHQDEENIRGRLNNLAGDLRARVGSDVEISSYVVASRAMPGSTEIGAGFQTLVETLFPESPAAYYESSSATPKNPDTFARLMERLKGIG